MAIDVNPTADEMSVLHDDLKAYEAQLATYLLSAAGQSDPNYDDLSKTDIQLNLQIFNLSTAQLQLAGDNAGAAVDAINSAVSNLNRVIAAKTKIATDLGIAQSAVSFVTAILSGNPSGIVSAGGTFVSNLNAIVGPFPPK
jgi:hypothetical protein